jgi:hypothetical protein
MKKIKLTNGLETIVDDDIFELVSKMSWGISQSGYAIHHVWHKIPQKRQTIFLHRLVNDTPDGEITDHINQDKLDNRKSNLRTVDKSVNAHNSKIPRNNTSGYKGVQWFKPHGLWSARIKVRGKTYHLGYFHDIEGAVAARKKAEADLL